VHVLRSTLTSLLAAIVALPLVADPVAVRQTEGLVHGFLTLSTLDGKRLADGELLQTGEGEEVTSRLVFHFRDGSLSDETTVYSQREHFRMLRNHLIRKGPAFPMPLEAWIDGTTGAVKVSYVDDGKTKTEEETMELPADLANGLILTMLKNVVPTAPETVLSFVALTPKPRLVHLEVTPTGEQPFQVGETQRKAMRYRVKVRIGGITGVMAKLVGKQPPDSSVWVLTGDHPAFVKSESPFYEGGDLWRIELTSPEWR